MLFALLLPLTQTWAAPRTKSSASTEDPDRRPPFILQLRGGYMLDNPDRAVLGRWEHKTFKSYQLALSGFYSFPQSKRRQVYFFAGPEFYYQSATQELEASTYTSSIEISIFRLALTGGIAYQPYWLGGQWGAAFSGAFEVWGQKTAALDAQGFTQDLGTESTRTGNSLVPVEVNAILAFYYDLGNLRPQLVFESNSTIGLGVAYAF